MAWSAQSRLLERGRRPWRLCLLLIGGLLLACSGGVRPRVQPSARLWFEGPVRWLMLPEEERAFQRLSSSREALDFIEEFWRQRDPTPADVENPFRTTFFERASAADQLYAEGIRRGSLTDRGRVLILFGSPSILRYRQKAVPTLAPARDRPGTRTRWMTQEIWAYLPEDLSPAFREALPEDARDREITFVFVAERKGTYLLEGKEYLELAARAAVRQP